MMGSLGSQLPCGSQLGKVSGQPECVCSGIVGVSFPQGRSHDHSHAAGRNTIPLRSVCTPWGLKDVGMEAASKRQRE